MGTSPNYCPLDEGNMEPDEQMASDEEIEEEGEEMSPEEIREAGATWLRLQETQKAASEECWVACQTGNFGLIRESFSQLGDVNAQSLLNRTVCRDMLEATRCLLELGVDPNTMPLSTLTRRCRSLDIYQLLAEFGKNYKSEKLNILV